MTQPSRTTETINRDNAAIRGIMHQIRELTMPDRATLALGLVGHLATMMNRSQMTRLMSQLQEEAERVQDVPPNRQRDNDQTDPAFATGGQRNAAARGADRAGRQAQHDDVHDGRIAASREQHGDLPRTKPHGDVLGPQVEKGGRESHQGVGQGGRGEFRSRKLL